MGGVAQTVRRWLTPPKAVRRMFTPSGGSDWIKEYEVGPKLAALTGAALTGGMGGVMFAPGVGAGVGALVHGTTEAGKATSQGKSMWQGAASGGAQGFGIGYTGGSIGQGLASMMSPTATVGKGTGAYSLIDPKTGGPMTNPMTKFAHGAGITGPTLATKTGGTVVGGGGGFTGKSAIPNLAQVGAAAASYFKKPPEFDYMTAQDRLAKTQSVLEKYMGESAKELPQAAADAMLKQIKTPLGELYPVERDARWGRVEPLINKSYDDYDKQINEQFAQAGGTGSSDHKKALADSRDRRSAELSQARNEIEHDVFKQQVSIKQDAIGRAAAQGRYDFQNSMEIAKMMGQDQDLMMAIESQDYESFQRLMAQIMQWGYEGTQAPVTMGGR